MSNKAAWAQNHQYYDEAAGPIEVTSTTLTIPDSISFAPLTNTGGQNVDFIDAEWSPGRVIEIFVVEGSSTITFRDNQAGTNIVLNGLTTACAEMSATSFRAWRDASGNKMWYANRAVFTIAS